MTRTSTKIWVVLSLLATGLWVAGCRGSKNESVARSEGGQPVVRVQVQAIASRPAPVTEEVVGTVRAKLRATLEARLSGRIDQLTVALGDKVLKGQLLARLDVSEVAARLEQVEAVLEEAERSLKRTAALFEQQSATRAEYEAAQSRQRGAKAAVAEAQAMLRYAEVLAPFDGYITRKYVERGDQAAPGKALLDLEDPSALQVEADVPEGIASHLARGRRLEVRVDAAPGDWVAVVSEMASAADPVSRTVRVRSDLTAATGLKPGQFARMAVPFGESLGIRVPAEAVLQRGQLEIVFSVTDHHARLHLVRAGRRIGKEIEILSGLDAGKVVVVSGADMLNDGQPVEVR